MKEKKTSTDNSGLALRLKSYLVTYRAEIIALERDTVLKFVLQDYRLVCTLKEAWFFGAV